MTRAELGSVFQVEDHEDVPEYEVVTLHHRRQRRAADRGHVHQVRHQTREHRGRVMSAKTVITLLWRVREMK